MCLFPGTELTIMGDNRRFSFLSCLICLKIAKGRGVGWLSGSQARDGSKQALGVGMLGVGEEFVGRPLLHYAALLHDHDAVGEEFHHGEVVSDKKIGVAVELFQIVKEVKHLSLHRDIECRDAFVTYHKFGLKYQCTGYTDSLPLSAREFVWVAVVPFFA